MVILVQRQVGVVLLSQYIRFYEVNKSSTIAGEFTPENQQRLKQEEEKEYLELDPWKVKSLDRMPA